VKHITETDAVVGCSLQLQQRLPCISIENLDFHNCMWHQQKTCRTASETRIMNAMKCRPRRDFNILSITRLLQNISSPNYSCPDVWGNFFSILSQFFHRSGYEMCTRNTRLCIFRRF